MKRKKKTCKAKGCKEKFFPGNSFHVACSPYCAIALEKQKKAAAAKRERKLDKVRIEALRPKSYWVKKAQSAFNDYIRERDRGQTCISCGTIKAGKYHAGHYQSVGSRPEFRFHPQNCHLQCAQCNNYMSGNVVNYRLALARKVGLDVVDYLEQTRIEYVLSVDDLKDIIEYFKEQKKFLTISLTSQPGDNNKKSVT